MSATRSRRSISPEFNEDRVLTMSNMERTAKTPSTPSRKRILKEIIDSSDDSDASYDSLYEDIPDVGNKPKSSKHKSVGKPASAAVKDTKQPRKKSKSTPEVPVESVARRRVPEAKATRLGKRSRAPSEISENVRPRENVTRRAEDASIASPSVNRIKDNAHTRSASSRSSTKASLSRPIVEDEIQRPASVERPSSRSRSRTHRDTDIQEPEEELTMDDIGVDARPAFEESQPARPVKNKRRRARPADAIAAPIRAADVHVPATIRVADVEMENGIPERIEVSRAVSEDLDTEHEQGVRLNKRIPDDDYDIPQGAYSSMRVKCTNGDISTRGFSMVGRDSTADIYSMNGDVEIRKIVGRSGNAKIGSCNGDISLEKCKVGSLQLDSENGDIKCSHLTLYGNDSFTVVEIDASSGDVEIDRLRLSRNIVDKELIIRSSNGDVSVTVERFSGTYTVKSGSGDVKVEGENIQPEASDENDEEGDEDDRNVQIGFIEGDGNNKILIESDSGDVFVKFV